MQESGGKLALSCLFVHHVGVITTMIAITCNYSSVTTHLVKNSVVTSCYVLTNLLPEMNYSQKVCREQALAIHNVMGWI